MCAFLCPFWVKIIALKASGCPPSIIESTTFSSAGGTQFPPALPASSAASFELMSTSGASCSRAQAQADHWHAKMHTAGGTHALTTVTSSPLPAGICMSMFAHERRLDPPLKSLSYNFSTLKPTVNAQVPKYVAGSVVQVCKN